ncbi:hypothetical protein L9F63_024128, partial [Diploptera punctata]
NIVEILKMFIKSTPYCNVMMEIPTKSRSVIHNLKKIRNKEINLPVAGTYVTRFCSSPFKDSKGLLAFTQYFDTCRKIIRILIECCMWKIYVIVINDIYSYTYGNQRIPIKMRKL